MGSLLPSVGIHFKSTDALLSPVLLSNSGGDLWAFPFCRDGSSPTVVVDRKHPAQSMSAARMMATRRVPLQRDAPSSKLELRSSELGGWQRSWTRTSCSHRFGCFHLRHRR